MKNILRTTSYTLGGLGAAVAIIPFIPSVFTQISAAIQQQQAVTEAQLKKAAIARQEELKQFTFEARKKTLDAASRIGEHIEYSNVTVENFTDNVSSPPKLDMSAFKPNDRIQVYDRNGVCIGRIRNQRFEWKHHYLNTCLTIEKQQEQEN